MLHKCPKRFKMSSSSFLILFVTVILTYSNSMYQDKPLNTALSFSGFLRQVLLKMCLCLSLVSGGKKAKPSPSWRYHCHTSWYWCSQMSDGLCLVSFRHSTSLFQLKLKLNWVLVSSDHTIFCLMISFMCLYGHCPLAYFLRSGFLLATLPLSPDLWRIPLTVVLPGRSPVAKSCSVEFFQSGLWACSLT